MKINIGLISLLLLISIIDYTQEASAQDIVRLELDATNLSLPFYTIPLDDHGMVVFRGTEIRGRRIIGWELIHYDILFKELYRHTISTERGGYFAGWETDEKHINLLFLSEQSRVAGEVFIYNISDNKHHTVIFHDPDLTLRNPSFVVSGSVFYLCGIHERSGRGLAGLRNSLRGQRPAPELVIVSGDNDSSVASIRTFPVSDMISLMHLQPDPEGDGVLIVKQISDGKYSQQAKAVSYKHEQSALTTLGTLPSRSERFLIDLCFIKTDESLLALAGTYGGRDKRSWRRGDPVLAEGLFFAFLNDQIRDSVRYYPFSKFNNLSPTLMQTVLKRSRSSGRSHSAKGQNAYRMLLHEKPYTVNKNMVLVGEAYYPEYEYDNRPQHLYNPYSFYGYYPGFYDSGSRWVFKGFRYEHAVIVAFDNNGNLLWDNSFETSNILEKSLNTRLRLLSYADEIVMVYAHDGRIWFRIIREDDVVVEKESYPLELPSASDRVREHYSMNMSPWYDSFFIVYGRQAIRGADGRVRVVYYCNKLAFE